MPDKLLPDDIYIKIEVTVGDTNFENSKSTGKAISKLQLTNSFGVKESIDLGSIANTLFPMAYANLLKEKREKRKQRDDD